MEFDECATHFNAFFRGLFAKLLPKSHVFRINSIVERCRILPISIRTDSSFVAISAQRHLIAIRLTEKYCVVLSVCK